MQGDPPYLAELLPRYPTNALWKWNEQVCDWAYKSRHDKGFSASEEQLALEAYNKREATTSAKKHKQEFFTAIVNKDLDCVKSLLKKLPSLIDRHTPYGATPLIVACAANDPKLVTLFLELGCSATEGDGIGATPVIMAASKGGTEVIKIVLDSKQGGNAGRTYLLSQATKNGEIAVMAASKAGHTDTLDTLLKAGAPFHHMTRSGANALMLACKHDRVECVKRLLAVGMKHTDVDPKGKTTLMYAAMGGAVQTIELLLSLKPPLDVTQPDVDGLTALEHACQAGHVPCADVLSRMRAELDPASPAATRLLLLAAGAGQGDMITWLIGKGIGTQLLMQPGNDNPMFAAVSSGCISAVDALLSAGVRLEVRDTRGRTPLAVAASKGLDSVVKLLVARGASMLATDMDGRVPRQIAARRNHRGTAALLSEMARNTIIVPESDMEKALPEVGVLIKPPHTSEGVWKPLFVKAAEDPMTTSIAPQTYRQYIPTAMPAAALVPVDNAPTAVVSSPAAVPVTPGLATPVGAGPPASGFAE